jgi:hypothetical protein
VMGPKATARAARRRRVRLVGQRREERDRASARADGSRVGGGQAPEAAAASGGFWYRSRRRIRSAQSCPTTSRISAARARGAGQAHNRATPDAVRRRSTSRLRAATGCSSMPATAEYRGGGAPPKIVSGR